MYAPMYFRLGYNKMPKKRVIGFRSSYDWIKCDDCGRQFNSKKLFTLHKKVAHNELVQVVDSDTPQCSVCNATFHDQKALLKHGRQHFSQ